jgi:hypothetical protein
MRRPLARVIAALVAAAVVLAALPAALVAAAGLAMAWRGGWQPARLYRAAGWCAPMVVAWLAATAIGRHSLIAAARAPYAAWTAMWHHGAAGSYLAAAVVITPAAVPAGLLAAGWVWSRRIRSMAAQAGGRSPASGVAFDERQWQHQVRSAAARIAAPGSAPLLTANGDVVIGAVIRAVGHPAGPLMQLPAERLRAHQIVIGSTGTGKSTLLLRLWAAYMAAGLARHAAGFAGAPLIVVLDCKGGADARRIADRARRVLRDAGARSVAMWPDEAALSLWELPPPALISTLVDLIEHGTGGAAYYADIMDAVVALAVDAPCGPPVSMADFLARLDPGWLALAYAAGGFDEQLAMVRSAGRQVPDIALRFRTLFRRLGDALDGPGSFASADAWYCVLEGITDVAVAEAQARALVNVLASYVRTGQRQVLLCVDEFSAVSRRLPVWELYERARSLGLTVQVSAQSWHGLARTEDDRYRLAATAEGGIWLLRTPYPDPLIALAGQRKEVASTRALIGRLRWSRTGTSRVEEMAVADPDRIRRLDTGQTAYLDRGNATFIQVKRLVASQAALPRPAAPPMPLARTALARQTAVSRPGALPDISALLTEVFGPPPGGSS